MKYGLASLANTLTNKKDILCHTQQKVKSEAQGCLSQLFSLHNISVINLLNLQTSLVCCQTKSDKL